MEIHAEFLKKDDRVEFAVLPYEEFVRLKEISEDYEDLIALREAKESESGAPTVSLSEARERFGK
jgi:hypothetical protein